MNEKVIQLRRASSYSEKLGNYIKELEEENKKLKEENEIVHKDFNELSEKYFFEKTRIDKAIEYIKKETYYNDIEGCCYELDYNKCEELLEILKGSEK